MFLIRIGIFSGALLFIQGFSLFVLASLVVLSCLFNVFYASCHLLLFTTPVVLSVFYAFCHLLFTTPVYVEVLRFLSPLDIYHPCGVVLFIRGILTLSVTYYYSPHFSSAVLFVATPVVLISNPFNSALLSLTILSGLRL